MMPPTHEQAGWAFVSVPGCRPLEYARLPMPPPLPGTVGYLDELLPDDQVPLGKCRGCAFTAPLSERGLCGRCEFERQTTAASLCP
jgi:hypothetical protein